MAHVPAPHDSQEGREGPPLLVGCQVLSRPSAAKAGAAGPPLQGREAILLIAFKDLGLVDATAWLSLSLVVALIVFCAALPGAIAFLLRIVR